MKKKRNILWEQLEEEARRLEERVKDLEMEIPPDAKSPKESYEELMEKINSREKERERQDDSLHILNAKICENCK